MKKLISLILALAMVYSLAVPAMAAEPTVNGNTSGDVTASYTPSVVIDLSGAKGVDSVYTGEPVPGFELDPDIFAGAEIQLTATYFDPDGNYVGTAPTDVGNYKVVLEIKGEGYTAEPVEVHFAITKAAITVTAIDQSINVGDTAPDLSAPELNTHYTVTGLGAGDALGGTVTMEYQKDGTAATPDTGEAGSYDIVISGATIPNDTNYSGITFVGGTLTISSESEPAVPTIPDPLYFKAAGATTVNVGCYDADGTLIVDADGNNMFAMTAVEGEEGIFSIAAGTLPEGTARVVFSSDAGDATNPLDLPTDGSNMYDYDNSKWTAYVPGSTEPAVITGVSITVDGTTYTEGNVTVTPDSTVSITVTDTNLQNGTEDNRIDYADGAGAPVTGGYFHIAEGGTRATLSGISVSDFANSSNREIIYYNNYTDVYNRTAVYTGIYVTYDDGSSAETTKTIYFDNSSASWANVNAFYTIFE